MAAHSVSQTPAMVVPSQLERHWQQAFRQRWQAVAPVQWRCIGIDVGKYEHVAVAYDGLGQLLARPLRFGIRAADYQAVFAWVALVAPDPAETLLFGLEPTGHYYEQLVYELAQRYGPSRCTWCRRRMWHGAGPTGTKAPSRMTRWMRRSSANCSVRVTAGPMIPMKAPI